MSVGHNFRLIQVPPALLPAALVILLIVGIGPNWVLAVASVSALLAGLSFLWRSDEAPILSFAFFYQWLQASVWTFYGNWIDKPIDLLGTHTGEIVLSTLLTLAGLVVFALGIRLGVGAVPRRNIDPAMQVMQQPLNRWFHLYLAVAGAATVGQMFAYVVPGLSQPLLALASLKWAFFFILGYASFLRGGASGQLFWIAFGAEFALSFGGYFSDFKTVFFVTLMAIVASGSRPSVKGIVGIGVLGVAVISMGIVWTAVKGDYRQFLSGGERAQIITVDFSTRIAKLVDLIGEVDGAKMSAAVEQTISRLGYVEFFGAVLNYVPQYTPHENGAIYLDAIVRPFMPRLFFPEKAIIDDSERTNMYTGLGVSGADVGTSISLGWIAEAFIDFGYIGMMPAILLVGFFYGTIYRRLSHANGAVGMGLATAVLLQTMLLESSITKIIGGVIVSLVIAWGMVRYVLPSTHPWLLAARPKGMPLVKR